MGAENEIASRGRRTEDINKDAEVSKTTMVLRSHKRKLAEAQQNVEVNNPTKKIRLSTSPKDKVLKDKECINLNREGSKFVTSTPLRTHLKAPNFNTSCIKSNKGAPDEVIVISDSSSSTMPVIILSDDDKDSDIEIIPTKVKSPRKKSVYSSKLAIMRKRKNIGLSHPARRGEKYLKQKPEGAENKLPIKTTNREIKTSLVGENIYVEDPVVLPQSGLRPIIIDGSNVAFHHSNNCYFSCKGLEICINYFKKRGHQVTAFVPHFRIQYNKSDNPKLLDKLVRNGDVILTPSRMVDGNQIVSYDDRFIVQTAAVKGGVIVTRDNYRDLLSENPAWADTIKYRLLQFTWVQDMLMFPSDPLGERGPKLDEFLRFG